MLWAAPLHARPTVAVDTLAQWLAGAKVSTAAVQRHGIDKCFTAEPVPTSVWQQMQGRTYKAGCPVPKADLRYLKLLHCDMQGRTTLGEMVCHRRIAQKLLHIFRRLYEARYPIACMRLADCYEADDERSMRANNTSAFNYRRVAGTRTVSKHGYGLAVDVKQDLLRAGASGSVGKMHDGFSFYSVRSLTDGLRFQFSVPDAEHLGKAV